MNYNTILSGIFLSRPNRFISHILLDGQRVVCHVKNTGRCKELLIPGALVYLEKVDSTSCRKTSYDLIAVRKGARLINLDSQAPNRVAPELFDCLFGPLVQVRPECSFGASRFDFFLKTPSSQIFLEVKGVTLESGGVALFPDAPTDRGVKHLRELIRCRKEGYRACILFLVQMKGIHVFAPNRVTHPAFADGLREAVDAGVEVFVYDCVVTPDTLHPDSSIPLCLDC
mgnify:CR=1 FL=1